MEAERSGLNDVIEDIVREGGCNKRKAELLETALNKMENRLDSYAELCNAAVGTLTGSEREEACRDRDGAYTDFKSWTRRARVKVRQHTQETPPKAHGAGRSHLQRVTLPYFSGRTEDWPEFRRYFGELTKDKQFPPPYHDGPNKGASK